MSTSVFPGSAEFADVSASMDRLVSSQPGGYNRSVSSIALRMYGQIARDRHSPAGPDLRRVDFRVQLAARHRGAWVSRYQNQLSELAVVSWPATISVMISSMQRAVGHRFAPDCRSRASMQLRHDVVVAHAIAAPAVHLVHDELPELPELVCEGKVALVSSVSSANGLAPPRYEARQVFAEEGPQHDVERRPRSCPA